jgi:hypothetical protein
VSPAHGEAMVEAGQLSQFLKFCMKKYRCVGCRDPFRELIEMIAAFLRVAAVKMFQRIRFRE